MRYNHDNVFALVVPWWGEEHMLCMSIYAVLFGWHYYGMSHHTVLNAIVLANLCDRKHKEDRLLTDDDRALTGWHCEFVVI